MQVMCEDHNSTREEWITMQRTYGHMKNKGLCKKMVACRVNCYTKNKLLCKQHTIAWNQTTIQKRDCYAKNIGCMKSVKRWSYIHSYGIPVKKLLSLAPQTSMSWNRLALAHYVGHVA